MNTQDDGRRAEPDRAGAGRRRRCSDVGAAWKARSSRSPANCCASAAASAAGASSSAWPGWRWRWPSPGACSSQRLAMTRAPSGPHTALVEVRGEIAADTEASAESLVAGAEERLRGQRRAGRGAAHQLARRQPGAGRHRQRRDPAPEGAAQEEGLRGGRGDLRLGRLLHRRGGRRDLRRQGQPRRLDRRADGRLRLHRRDGQARRRAPPAHRRREQGHARPVLAAEREAARLRQGDDRPDPPAVHQGGEARAAASA